MDPAKKDFWWKSSWPDTDTVETHKRGNNFINDFLSLLASSLINTDLAASTENACG